MKSLHLFFVLALFLSSCSKTIEQQVETLVEEDDYNARVDQANELAGSFNPRAVDLLGGIYSSNQNSAQGLKDMLLVYLKGADAGSKSANDSTEILLRYMTGKKNGSITLTDSSKVELIIFGLKNCADNGPSSKLLIESALSIKERAMITIMDSCKTNLENKNLIRCLTAFGDAALFVLLNEVGRGKKAESLLGYFGESAVQPLLRKMKSSNQDDRYAAADALVKISKTHPSAVQNLTDVFDNGSLKGIAKNYPFYIRLGASGTEKLLLKALRNNFSEEMLKDYLNCGNGVVEDGARAIASEKGYMVYQSIGSNNGPTWGSGN